MPTDHHDQTQKARDNFLTPKECAEQLRLYAVTNPRPDNRHSLNFAADFLDEYCQQTPSSGNAANTSPVIPKSGQPSKGALRAARAFKTADVDLMSMNEVALVIDSETGLPELLEACKFFLGALEDGDLLRDTSKDHNPDWALKAMKFVADLAKAQQAVSRAGAEQKK